MAAPTLGSQEPGRPTPAYPPVNSRLRLGPPRSTISDAGT